MKVEELPDSFKQYANKNGISLISEDDWVPWYNCWYAGFNSGYESCLANENVH